MQQDPSIPAQPADATSEPPVFNVGQPVDETPPVVTDENGKKPRGSRFGGALSTIAILVAAPLIALALTAFVFQSYEVDGPSMETTLQNADRLIVWKVPRTLARITHHPYIPHRSDVVIFVKHGLYEPGSSQEKQLIKRVVGLPGERVVVQNGSITVYNKQNPDGFNPDINHDFSQNIAPLTTGNIDIVVPENEVFVCGDNRTNSLDSRSFGTVPVNDIVGKLSVRIFPVNKFKSFI